MREQARTGPARKAQGGRITTMRKNAAERGATHRTSVNQACGVWWAGRVAGVRGRTKALTASRKRKSVGRMIAFNFKKLSTFQKSFFDSYV